MGHGSRGFSSGHTGFFTLGKGGEFAFAASWVFFCVVGCCFTRVGVANHAFLSLLGLFVCGLGVTAHTDTQRRRGGRRVGIFLLGFLGGIFSRCWCELSNFKAWYYFPEIFSPRSGFLSRHAGKGKARRVGWLYGRQAGRWEGGQAGVRQWTQGSRLCLSI
ncbi:hypothetical protein VTJ04DRAFT_8842 [Mycothermus thermophilus]|uniref:uncharacterized protein n=1 Tax=Humicola insolens TaxID=85995 RepID=UPI0037434688